MFENYDVSGLLDGDGKFKKKSNDNILSKILGAGETVTTGVEEGVRYAIDFIRDSKEKVSNIVDSYYNKTGTTKRASDYMNGPHKQLLIQTIDKLGRQDPFIKSIKGYLMDTAALESGFTLNITVNPKVGTGSGWFGFLDSTKKNILTQLGVLKSPKEFTKKTRDWFNNNAEIQVKAAAQLYKNIIQQAKRRNILNVAAKKGFTEEEVVHSYWLNPTWAEEYFLYGKKGGKDAFGTSVESYINKLRRKAKGPQTKKKK